MFSQTTKSEQENTRNKSNLPSLTKLDSSRQQQHNLPSDTSLGGNTRNNDGKQIISPRKSVNYPSQSYQLSDEEDSNQSAIQSTNFNSKMPYSKASSQVGQSRTRIKSQLPSDDSDEGFEDSQELKINSDSEIGEVQKTAEDNMFAQLEEKIAKKQGDRLPPPPMIDQQYSLVPDMIAGWRPKFSRDTQLPPPIPLSFDDESLDYIIEKLLRTQRYTILYLGFRPKTSYDFHREYSGKVNGYSFKYGNILLQKNVLSQFNIQVETESTQDQQNDNKSDYYAKKRPFIGMNTLYPKNLMQFDSMFEGGNLDCIIKLSDSEYDLYMRVDSNTKGHLQWYNFRVFNTKKGDKIKFNILNFTKKRSLYQRVFIIFLSFLFEKRGVNHLSCLSFRNIIQTLFLGLSIIILKLKYRPICDLNLCIQNYDVQLNGDEYLSRRKDKNSFPYFQMILLFTFVDLY